MRIDGPPLLLEPNIAQAMVVILHELATNAAKYGGLSVANGRVDLTWSNEADGQLHLRWTETGGPEIQEPTHKGFGSRIIERMIAQQSGKTRFDWRAEGLICELTLRGKIDIKRSNAAINAMRSSVTTKLNILLSKFQRCVQQRRQPERFLVK